MEAKNQTKDKNLEPAKNSNMQDSKISQDSQNQQNAKDPKTMFDKKFTTKQLLKLVLPSVIAMLIASVYSIVDGIFVSNYGGTTAFAAINQISPLLMIVAAIGFMFGTGGTALVSKYQGQGEDEKAKKLFSFFTYVLIVVGVVCSVVLAIFIEPLLKALGTTDDMMPYCVAYGQILIPCLTLFMLQYYFQSFLACAGKAHLGLIFTIIAGIVNVIGDAQLVGVFSNGDPLFAVRGAAIATGLGLIVGGLVPLIYFLCKNKSTLRLGKPLCSFKELGKACGNGISEFLTNISASVVNAVYNCLFLAMVGSVGVAAYGAVSYVNTVFCAIISGFVLGVAPAIAYNYGAGNTENLQTIHKKSKRIVAVTGVITTVLVMILVEPLASMFSHGDDLLMRITTEGLLIFSLSFLFKALPMYGSGFFTALNNGFASGFISVVRTLVLNLISLLLVPLLFLHVSGMEVGEASYYGVWYSVVLTEILALIMTFIFFKAYRKKYNY